MNFESLKEINFSSFVLFYTEFYTVLSLSPSLHSAPTILFLLHDLSTCILLLLNWVFLRNLLKSLHLSLSWDSFLGQDHCLHKTNSFFLGSIFWWHGHPETMVFLFRSLVIKCYGVFFGNEMLLIYFLYFWC